jgi:hypothetical protein
MKGIRIIVLAAALCVLPLSVVSARGAGGITWGQELFTPSLSNFDLQTTYSGGYGYGVTRDGQRMGGFVLGLHSSTPSASLDAGFLGLITGQEVHLGPVMGAVNLWTGFGGMSASTVLNTPDSFALFGELDLEIGFGFTRGMQLTGYAGMQAIVSVREGQPLFSNVMYTPVLGLRLAWGSF